MAMPKDLRTLFNDLPNARAARDAAQKQAEVDRESAEKARLAADAEARVKLRAELEVAWDWLQTDGQELAAEIKKASFLRMQLLGPLDSEGREVGWQLDARVLLLNEDGLLEVVRQDAYRELRYPVRTVDDFLNVEPPAFTRAFIDAVRSGAIWQRVAQQVRQSTSPAREIE